MKTILTLITLTCGLLAANSLSAGEPFFQPYCKLPAWLDVTRCRCCTCPDDYCKKCLPAPPCRSPLGCCDDYRRKCLPWIPCKTPLGCCDDYCRKCGPIRLPACPPSWYSCGPEGCAE